jgi:hypothetical protein
MEKEQLADQVEWDDRLECAATRPVAMGEVFGEVIPQQCRLPGPSALCGAKPTKGSEKGAEHDDCRM